jgi:type IV pilus assembly protein PilC
MLFKYTAIDTTNATREGTVDASSIEAAIATVQKRGYTITAIDPVVEEKSIMNLEIEWFQRITNKEVVILSRQIATLFEAQVSALRIFKLLAAESENPLLQRVLTQISDDLQAGSSISRAFSGHPDVFSNFYVSMVRSGEESGTLEQSFSYLADYLDRSYQVVTKVRNALVYPAFVVGIFILVMGLMLTLVIPRISQILTEAGQELPIYTVIVLGLSDFLVNYIGILLILMALAGFGVWRFIQTDVGRRLIDEMKVTLPFFGKLSRQLYLTRICDNLSTMLASGISMVQALEVTGEVVDNMVFKEILDETLLEVKAGRSFADAIGEYPEIPGVLAQMARVGEETGNLADILTTLAKFYSREVNNSVDTMIGLIEPAMIVLLGLGVATLLASVLMPIYNLTNTI